MKTILRNIATYTLALYFLPKIIAGLEIQGGFVTMLIGGIALTIMFFILKPIMSVLSYPLNLLTLGLFSILTNILILYLLTIFVDGISIIPFKFPGANIAGFVLPKIAFNMFFAYAVTSVALTLLVSLVKWLIR